MGFWEDLNERLTKIAADNQNTPEQEAQFQDAKSTARADYDSHKGQCQKCTPGFPCGEGERLMNRVKWSSTRTRSNRGFR